MERWRPGEADLVDAAVAFCTGHPALSGQVEAARRLLELAGHGTSLWACAALPAVREELLLPATVAELSERTRRLLAAVDAAPSTAVWDHVVVGGGIVGSALATEIRRNNPGARCLVIEAGVGSRSFMASGRAFHLNTWNTPAGREDQAMDGLNAAAGPPLAILSGALFPAGDALAHASALALYACGADVLLDARVAVVRLRDAQAPAEPFALDVVHGGQRRTLVAGTVTLATGYGQRRLELEDAESRALVASELDRIDSGDPNAVSDPVIAAADQVLRLAHASVDPLHLFRGDGPICVAGGGHSACTLLELAFRLAPARVYDGPGALARALGRLAPILWVTGNAGPKSAVERRLAVFEPGTLDAVFAERYAQLYHHVPAAQERGELQLCPARVRRVRLANPNHASGGVLIWLEGETAPRQVRRLLLATGYEPALPALWPNATFASLGFAMQAAGPSGTPVALYLAGSVLEAHGVADTKTSPLRDYVPRALALARERLGDGPRGPALELVASAPRVLPAGGEGSARVDTSPPLPAGWGPARPVTEASLLTMPFDVAQALCGFRFEQRDSLTLVLSKTGMNGIEMACDSLSAESLGRIAEALRGSPRLLRGLCWYAASGPVTFHARLDPSTSRVEPHTVRMIFS